MANQTYDLTQTGQEVQNIINDANGAKNAAAQTTLTTDYVMLKDTSGNYHKIDKSSFTEAIRDTLATLLTNNDKGTTFNLVPAIASGDFGSVTPENLASVLGVCKVEISSPVTDYTLPFGGYGIYVFENISDGTSFCYLVDNSRCEKVAGTWTTEPYTITVTGAVITVTTIKRTVIRKLL